MARKKNPGLQKKPSGIWHIDKTFNGTRLCESTGTSSLEEANAYLSKRIEDLRNATVYGIRPDRTFRDAATRYLTENLHKRSIDDDALHLEQLDPWIGELYLKDVHDDTLFAFKEHRLKDGKKKKTVNLALEVVRRILNLAAQSWRDENSLTWLLQAPKITMLKVDDAAKPYPLSWSEQRKLFQLLPAHIAEPCLFKVNTGTREQEVCQLRWEWEFEVPELNTSVFIVPGWIVKNDTDRLVVLNDVAKRVIDSRRGKDKDLVFAYRGKALKKLRTTTWRNAWEKAGLPIDGRYTKGVHNLKHTFGMRLRSAGVAYEDRQDLLGHSSGSVTTHYSAPEIGNLIQAANLVREDDREITLLRKVV